MNLENSKSEICLKRSVYLIVVQKAQVAHVICFTALPIRTKIYLILSHLVTSKTVLNYLLILIILLCIFFLLCLFQRDINFIVAFQ